MRIFTKARVSNFTAGTVVLYSMFALTTMTLDAVQMTALGTIIGFASKHLVDQARSMDE